MFGKSGVNHLLFPWAGKRWSYQAVPPPGGGFGCLGHRLGDVLYLDLPAPVLKSAAELQDAAGAVAHQEVGAGGGHCVQLILQQLPRAAADSATGTGILYVRMVTTIVNNNASDAAI